MKGGTATGNIKYVFPSTEREHCCWSRPWDGLEARGNGNSPISLINMDDSTCKFCFADGFVDIFGQVE